MKLAEQLRDKFQIKTVAESRMALEAQQWEEQKDRIITFITTKIRHGIFEFSIHFQEEYHTPHFSNCGCEYRKYPVGGFLVPYKFKNKTNLFLSEEGFYINEWKLHTIVSIVGN